MKLSWSVSSITCNMLITYYMFNKCNQIISSNQTPYWGVQILNYFIYIFHVFLYPKILMHNFQKSGDWFDWFSLKHSFSQYDGLHNAVAPVSVIDDGGTSCKFALQLWMSRNKLEEKNSQNFNMHNCRDVLCACNKSNT